MIYTQLTSLLFPLAQVAADDSRQDAYRRGYSLILMLSLLGILAVMMLVTIIILRRSRLRRQADAQLGPTEHIDAWAESGRRFDNSITEIDLTDDES